MKVCMFVMVDQFGFCVCNTREFSWNKYSLVTPVVFSKIVEKEKENRPYLK